MKKEIDNSGQKELFPETADEGAGNPGTAIPHISAPNNAAPPCPGESTDKLPTIECNPASVKEIANSDLKGESEQLVDAHEAAPQTRPSDLIPSSGDAGDSQVHCEPSNKPSKNPHDCAGGVPAVSEESDRIIGIDTSSTPASHDDDEEFVARDTVSVGEQPNACTSFGGSCNDPSDLNSLATSKEIARKGEPSNDAATETDKPTALALPDSNEEQTVHKERTGAGLDEAGADVPMQEQSQTAGASPEVGASEQDGLSKQTEENVSAPGQRTEVPVSATGRSKPKRCKQSHPKVIVNERDCLSKSEEEILDRLKELNLKQLELSQNSLTDEVQAGYADLLTTNATCTKTAYRNIPKLIEKGFIDFVKKGNEERPGSGAKYRIVPEDKVKERRLEKKLTHWVQVGPARKAVLEPKESNEHDD